MSICRFRGFRVVLSVFVFVSSCCTPLLVRGALPLGIVIMILFRASRATCLLIHIFVVRPASYLTGYGLEDCEQVVAIFSRSMISPTKPSPSIVRLARYAGVKAMESRATFLDFYNLVRAYYGPHVDSEPLLRSDAALGAYCFDFLACSFLPHSLERVKVRVSAITRPWVYSEVLSACLDAYGINSLRVSLECGNYRCEWIYSDLVSGSVLERLFDVCAMLPTLKSAYDVVTLHRRLSLVLRSWGYTK